MAVVVLSSALRVLDLTDDAFRRWWSARAFTTDAIAGILVVLITVLIVNQALGIRRERERFRDGSAGRPGIESGHSHHPSGLGLRHIWRSHRSVGRTPDRHDHADDRRTNPDREQNPPSLPGRRPSTGRYVAASPTFGIAALLENRPV